ncbi:hypothetical protein GXP67_06530 [Rhodocytophaga rosea]|uniref:SbsA Ig-like domain-containing protein n=1 Tax=Rhodocytophaga rosea TaxID=2704465 RepID=A0A6C0GEJ9_9BACT|nr:Ig-like domain-containing protein [Rhodocytophaga rosea]QHT66337.1 hypothetical protein GXP67_06530 [Rhodocytophaga rosea]
MKSMFKLFAFAVLMVSMVTINSCKKDEDDPPFAISSLKAGDIDLNGANSATGVLANSPITATFTGNVDPTSTVQLQRDYDDANLNVTVTASGNTLTIDPAEDFGGGTLYILSLNGIKSQKGEVLTVVDRSFTTEGSFVPVGQIAYWNFEDNANDVVGAYDPAAADIVAVTYVAGRKAGAGKAAEFNGDNSIIEVPNGPELMNTNNFTLSFWVKTNSSGHVNETDNPTGHFVMGLGASRGFQFEIDGGYNSCKLAAQYDLGNGATASEDLWFPGDGKDANNGGWQGWDFVKDLTSTGGVPVLLKDKWAHIVCTYDAATKKGSMYINGEKMKGQDFNLWPAGEPKRGVTGLKYAGTAPEVGNKLAFGFIYDRSSTWYSATPWGNYNVPTANHFKGQLDDVRIFHEALTAQEVKLVYDSEK